MPGDDTVKKLQKIWAELLGLTGVGNVGVGLDDDFFLLGGHSLKAAGLVAKIHKAFNIRVPLAEVFEKSSIRELGLYIEKIGKQEGKERFYFIENTEEKEYYDLSPAQKRLYLLHRMDPASTVYNVPGVFILEGQIDEFKIDESFKAMIRRHESLRTSFHMVNGEPVQVVHVEVEFKMEYFDPGGPVLDR
ncbi:MAG: condensation domain-containing protein, partial [Acidobacteria bacterium]|nr:condensation domain-containing protein [Acidobacteriota bacterium]